MIPPGLLRRLGPLVALAAVYFISGELGLRLAFVNESATAVWPPTGIALAALVLFGSGLWPAILVSAFLVNLTITGAVTTSLGIAVGNTLEALAGAYLVNRFAHGRRAFDHARDTFTFTLLAGLASTMISATIGVLSIALGGFARWSDFGLVWLTWWLGDVAGAMVVAPAALLWGKNPRIKWDRTRMIEATALLLCVIVVTLCAFGGVFPSLKNYPLEFL
jgi:integral membrane sensor domain MASE1